MRSFKIYTVVFAIGAVAYTLIEIAWRGYTHISMTIAGGSCLVGLFFLEKRFRGLSFLSKCIVGAMLITSVEFVVGYIVNLVMGLAVWDYSDRFLNIMGQVCPLFTVLWFLICMPALGICIGIRKLFDDGEADEN